MDSIKLLGTSGDPMERAIVEGSMEELGGILSPYADIWARYVFSTRLGTGEFVKDGCVDFASSHYTALIRAHNALGFYNQIKSLCEVGDLGSDGMLLLELQANISAYWWALGALVDNLGQTLENFPGSTAVGLQDAGLKLLKAENAHMKYLYERRTQLIHSRIVPITVHADRAVFDYRYLDGKRREVLPASTEWKTEFTTPGEVGIFYSERWVETKRELANAWHAVRRILDSYASRKTDAMNWQKIVEQPRIVYPSFMTASSACASVTLPAPSGTGRPPGGSPF
ncbi:MAG: hypothetical protein P4L85_14160 [Paludisphaera borealis]|uniref:hypothetical protein n=1 Tax=Paludisphaera borealis TaxID=1387353 RepID=UPI0028476D97|nr:hypothetical protein [Paludisphaera borealis]MDR3620490.1 hypothetical protein [Paludisphaera borealis]